MRKREIHSVAHWAMMFILLMFPLLMVVVGAFQNADYQPEIVEQRVDYQYLQNNCVYIFNNDISDNKTNEYGNDSKIFVENVVNINGIGNNVDLSNTYYLRLYMNNTYNAIQFYDSQNNQITSFNLFNTVMDFSFTYKGFTGNVNVLPYYNYFYIIETIDNYHYKNDVNLWTKSFLDLPINSWYKSLMNVIGVGFTNSSVMNVIYVMPVYILWVFIFDVIVDCFLVIIKLPHKLLNRLSGGENE